MSTVGTIIADETHAVSIPEQGTEQRKSGDLRTGASVSRSTGSDTADWPVFRRVSRCVQFCGTLEPGALSSEKHRVKETLI